jgi:hypothetical protein
VTGSCCADWCPFRGQVRQRSFALTFTDAESVSGAVPAMVEGCRCRATVMHSVSGKTESTSR